MRVAGPLLLLAACSGPATRPAPLLPPAAPAAAVVQVHAGVLRSLMITGELHVRPDDATLAALAFDGVRELQATLSIWRFRPYARDGRRMVACGTATFRHRAGRPAVEALPAAAVEQPAGAIAAAGFDRDEVNVPPTPGVALVRVCRRRGTRSAPQLTFMQSSGDAATDRPLLDEREVAPQRERPGGSLCRIRSRIHDIHPGVLRGLVTEGLIIAAGAPREGAARVSVCLDAEGMATSSLIESSEDATYDQNVLNAVAAWRFRPYVRDGAAAAGCAVAAFHLHQLDGLPEEAVELPKGRARPGHFAAGETRIPATPGVALAEVCRVLGSRAAPTIRFLQSSGDAAVDRALLDQRAVVPVDEAAGGEVCRIDAGIAIETRPRPPSTKNVVPRALERRRVAGTPVIIPTDRIKNLIYARRVGCSAASRSASAR